MVYPQTFDTFAAICKENSDLKHEAGIGMLCRLYRACSPEQIVAALRGEPPPADVPGERRERIQDACNAVSRGALDLDQYIDQALADGDFDDDERRAVHRMRKLLIDRIDRVAVHANQPAGLVA